MSDGASLKIYLFGPFEVWRNGQLLPASAFGRKKTRHLLKLLASERGRIFSKDQLTDALFPDLSPDKAAVNLSGRVGELRRALEPDLAKNVDSKFVLTQGQGYVLSKDSACWVDIEAFADHTKEARELEATQRWSQAQDSYEQAACLYRDILFAEDPYEEWTLAPRQRFESIYLEVLSRQAECYGRLEQFSQAIECCQKALQLTPTQEAVYRQQMHFQALAGRQSQALETYETCINVLKDLGVEPSPETRTLYLQIQKHALPAAPKAVNQNLPSQSTCFLGRTEDLQNLSDQLRQDDCRLLTILGQGGLGKTQLAIHVAHTQLEYFADGVFLASLASVTTLNELLVAIAEAIGFHFQGRQSLKEQLLEYLSHQEMLLVLDSSEHLKPGMDAVVELLDQAPQVKILATSRERLNIKGEWVYALEGLSVPDDSDDSARTHSAVQLFLEQAERSAQSVSESDLAHVVKICQLVEGLPLGIELAAGWMGTLSCEEIASEIENSYNFLTSTAQDMPDRHRSLRAVFEQSWAQLSEQEQEALAGLSLFHSAFDRHAAQQVAGASLPLLLSLIHKSLLRQTTTQRYSLHELLRQFILEKAQQDEARYRTYRDHHGRYFSTFMAQRQYDLKGRRQKQALHEIANCFADIRTAWHWLNQTQARSHVHDMLRSLYLFYEKQGLFLEGNEFFETAAQCLAQTEDSNLLAKLLTHRAALCYRLGELDTTTELLQQGLAILEQTPDPSEEAFAHHFLGNTTMMKGEFDQSKTHLETACQLYREQNDDYGLAGVLNELGILADKTGDLEAAKRFYEEGLALKRQAGDLRGMATTSLNLGYVAFIEGDYKKTRRLVSESLEIFVEMNDRLGIAISINNLADVEDKLGHYEAAIERYQECIRYCRRIGDQLGVAIGLVNMANTLCRNHQPEKARNHYPEALQIAMDTGAHPIALDAMLGFSSALKNQKQHEQAFKFVAFSLTHPALEKQLETKAKGLFEELSELMSDQQIETLQETINDWELNDAANEIYRLHPILNGSE